jgi:serine protease Do
MNPAIPRMKNATYAMFLKGENGYRLLGSGFFVSPDGLFITAAHVIESCSSCDGVFLHKETMASCTNAPGRWLGPVKLVASDAKDLDLAVLKAIRFGNGATQDVPSAEFPYLTLSAEVLEEGEPVYSFGYTFLEEGWLSPRLTSAIVSAISYEWKCGRESWDDGCYVIDKHLEHGNSGGPLVALSTGKAHGIIVKAQRSQTVENPASYSAARRCDY